MATRRPNPTTVIKNQKLKIEDLEDERDELAEENDILRARLQRAASLLDTSDIDQDSEADESTSSEIDEDEE
jgi:hypothetical protein